MTEIEYVQRIRTSAEEYLSFIRGEIEGEQARNAIARWEHMKTYLSPHTAIRMCEAWLSGNGTEDA